MQRSDDSSAPWEVDAPCLHYVWNHPELLEGDRAAAALFKNVRGLMSQVCRGGVCCEDLRQLPTRQCAVFLCVFFEVGTDVV